MPWMLAMTAVCSSAKRGYTKQRGGMYSAVIQVLGVPRSPANPSYRESSGYCAHQLRSPPGKACPGCRSFLWRGIGIPSYDDTGKCSCLCAEGWRTSNIAGYASCVPRPAYQCFSYAGLLFTLVHLLHAAHNFKSQRRSEASGGRGVLGRKLVDVYREQLSVISIAHAPVIGIYFVLALWLPDNVVHLSSIALGISHILSGIGAVLTVQVLIRSTDPRLMKKGAAALKVSAALTHPVGRVFSYSVVSIGAVLLIFLASTARTGKGYRIISIIYISVTVTRILVIITCSHSMIRIIDKSMAQHVATRLADSCGTTDAQLTVAMDPKLKRAKKTILSALFFCINLTSIASAVLLLALSTDYGYDNPIVFLATPLAFGPMIALTYHIQLHSKRNKPNLGVSPSTAASCTVGSTASGGGTKTFSSPSIGSFLLKPFSEMKGSHSRIMPMEVGPLADLGDISEVKEEKL